MRRMITNKQVVEVVNKAIDDGEIEVGGLPKIEEGDAGKVLKVNEQEDGVEWGEAGGADNALVLPETAPASQQLVGINTSNEQNSLTVGDGLEIVNGELQSALKFMSFDVNKLTQFTDSSIQIDLTTDQLNYIQANHPLIIINFTDGKLVFNPYHELLPHSIDYSATLQTSNDTSSYKLFLKQNGDTLSLTSCLYYNMSINISNSKLILYKGAQRYMFKDIPYSIVPNNVNNVTIASGAVLTDSTAKRIVEYKGCLTLNGLNAYPEGRTGAGSSADPYIYTYFAIALNGTNVELIIFTINKSTWVVTITTKTIA